MGTRRRIVGVARHVRVYTRTATDSGEYPDIDMAFDVVEQLCGAAVADETAHYIEYRRSR